MHSVSMIATMLRNLDHVMTRLDLLQKLSSLLGRFAHEVMVANAMGQFDINRIAEDFLIPILGIAFGCPDLRNQNRIQMNFPAVDLGCTTSRTSIQITSDPSSEKILETLNKFETHNLQKDFDKLFVYVITERQRLYTSKKLAEKIDGFPIKFNASNCILDFWGLAKLCESLTNEQLEQITAHLEGEFKRADANLQFRRNLDAFLEVSQKKIENEKASKKYIPSIFVETSETKEYMRYFANPMFFFRKIDNDLSRINIDHFNELLSLSKIAPIAEDIRALAGIEEPKNLDDLKKRFTQQRHTLEAVQTQVSPFSWYAEEKRFKPSDYLTGYWEVFRHSIVSSGSGVFSSLDAITKKIRIALAKIFLVTGMAGQGKTNFVCDLIEKQFRAFQVPTIFIPARSLNDHPGPNRILSYISNNRFAPDVSNLHDLLALLNNVAKENQKPFIIAIDGINEVGDLDGFSSELRVFLEAMCQYDYVKAIITCRNEFFDHKFAGVFEPQFVDHLHRVENLRSEMSEHNKSRLLEAYLNHFKINATFSQAARGFLKNDLILLRIFSEINEGQNIGYVPDIYKGDIFEKYLTMRISQFPSSTQQKALDALLKICSRMFDDEDFSQVAVDGFDHTERQILERLIGEDIILRREVPTTGLASLGVENISFTYDELRDFLLSYFTVFKLATSNPSQVSEIFAKIPSWPIYEGFFRYSYVLARKQNCKTVIFACESSPEFEKHYLNNLPLLSADIQTPDDVKRVKLLLSDDTSWYNLREVAWFLFRKREISDNINIRILLDHVNTLDDDQSERFMNAMFRSYSDVGHGDWRNHVSKLLDSLNKLSVEQKLGLGLPELALAIHFAPHARWDERETTLNFFTKFKDAEQIRASMSACENAVSLKVRNCLKEIAEERTEI